MSLNVLFQNETHKIETAGVQVFSAISKYVSPTDIILAFPASAIAELNDYAASTENTIENRGTAQQILYAVQGNRDLDVLSDKFNDMLNFMVAEIPSYTTEANDAFKLQIGI
jgi:hypothetical protein